MKKFFQFALVAVAAVGLVACNANKNNGSGSQQASTEASADANKTYTVKYSITANAGANWETLSTEGDQIETPFQAEIDGDKVIITMPMKVVLKGNTIKRSLKEGSADFCIENSSEKGRIEFKLADDKDYDAEIAKLKAGDTIEFTVKGETTKDVLDKMNGNWGTFALSL